MSLTTASLCCTVLGSSYVGILYLVTPKNGDPNDFSLIKRRGLAVSLVTMLSPAMLWFVAEPSGHGRTLLEHLGFSCGSLMQGASQTLLPLALNATLFLGPLVQQFYDEGFMGTCKNFIGSVKSLPSDLHLLRAAVIAPITEEVVFRSCMVPLLLPSLGMHPLLYWGAPMFFGIAHLHHILEGKPIPIVCLQFGYTTVFGALETYIFARTSSILGPIACHAFSNIMGFPDFDGALRHPRKFSLKVAYVAGLIGFFALTGRLTDPSIYPR